MTAIQLVLQQAHLQPFTTKSDFARLYADAIAIAASDGFITTKLAVGLYSRSWSLTPSGLSHLYTLQGEHHA